VLTTLGIVIGIAAVIAMMEIGQGASIAVERTILSMGANNLMVLPGTAASGGVSFGAGSVLTLTEDDAQAIMRECPAVRNVAPIVRVRTQVVYQSKNWVPMFIYGTTPEYLEVREWTNLAEGTMFTSREVAASAKVCIIGQTIVRELFFGESAVGRELRVQGVNLRVVGVLGSKGANMMGMDQDDIVIAPWTTIKYRVSNAPSATGSSQLASSAAESGMKSVYPGTGSSIYPSTAASGGTSTFARQRYVNVDQIVIAARSKQEIEPAIAQITSLLRQRHRIRPGEPDDFTIRNMTEMTTALTSTNRLMTRLLLVVALISLIVGGVGIMNIMLVSVTERTREIGIRLAVGAKKSDVLKQFLVEAVILCLAGGVLGIVLGRAASVLVAVVLKWPTAVSVGAIVAAVSVSATVGVVFGFYPAWKASRLNPVEALRYE